MMCKNKRIQNETALKEAHEILAMFAFYRLDGQIYMSHDCDAICNLFDSVVASICETTLLKPELPYQEFVHPSNQVIAGDPGWVGHFEELDNKKFFLSDVYDFLTLYFGLSKSTRK